MRTIFVLLLILTCTPTLAQAHALLARNIATHPEAVVVEFAYAGGESAAYREVKVYSQGNAEIEFQNGRTDAAGRFAFSPNTHGSWLLVAADGMGHKVSHHVEVAPGASATPRSSESALSVPLRACLGVSLLMNLFLGLHVWRKRMPRP